MLQFLGLCIVSVFTVIGIFESMRYAVMRLYREIECSVTIHTSDYENDLEYTVRSIAAYCPKILIDVIDDRNCRDTSAVLYALMKQYPQIRLKTDI